MSSASEVIRVGPVALRGRALLAPMSGVTDLGMRRAAERFGATLAVSEMVASDEFAKGAHEAVLRADGAGIAVPMVQLAGCDPRWMSEAARLAEASGAAIIDINMGCPAKRVTGGYSGSALMRDLDHAIRLVEATVAAVRVPVTLKMRLGWDHGSLNAPELARRAELAGVQMITVHGRTRCQFYKGTADWSAIGAVKRAVGVPVVANGDCASPADARAMLAQSGADAVMVGRAALGQPWLVGRISQALATGRDPGDPPAFERAAAALAHYAYLLEAFGERAGLRHARKHLAAYADTACSTGLAVPGAARDAIVRSDDPRTVTALLRDIFAAPPCKEAA
jgi:tRNA-dihydrouridine synthase B